MARDLLTVQASTVVSESAFSISGRPNVISSLEGELYIEQELHDVEVKVGFAISLSDEEIVLDEAASEARSEAS
ncbi:zinc finger BED domain-containing protein RICESLEEPER 2-like protein [Tanacetum coccineum]